MSLWRQLRAGGRTLLRPRATDRDLVDEVQHFLAEATAAHAARGLSPAAAARAARLELGGEAQVTEELRSHGWERWVTALLADARYALRRLRREPGFTALVVLTVALAVGTTTAIFSAVAPILLAPLPYPRAERVVTLWERTEDGTRIDTTFATATAAAARSHSLAALALMRDSHPALTGGGRPERLDGQRVSASWFAALGVPAARGRAFTAAEDRPGAPRVAVISDALWRRRFGGDPAILGRVVHLDGDATTIVGIMPRGFENLLAPRAAVWTPLRYDLSLPQAFGHHLRAVARLRDGVTPAEAARELAALTPALQREIPAAHVGERLLLVPLQEEVTRAVRPALLAVGGAVLLLLLLACVNLTHLLLARGARRRGELAVRAALGAGRARVVRQLLVESVLLALPGGLLGVALAAAGVRGLVAASPLELPRAGDITVDGGMLAFSLALTALVGLAFGLGPALRAVRPALAPELRAGSRRTAGGGGGARLVIAEVALALVLLVGAGLLLRSLHRLLAVPPGFAPRGLLAMQVQAADHRFDGDAVAHHFFADALAAVRHVPGVTAAAWTSQLPLSGDDDEYGARFAPSSGDEPASQPVFRYAVSPGYVEALGMPLRAGRAFDDHDRAGAQPVALVGEALARRLFPRGDAVGQRVQLGPTDAPWYTVVGVVGDVRQRALGVDIGDSVYVPAEQWAFTDRSLWLVVRGRGDVAALAPAVRRAVWSVDADQPIAQTTTVEALVEASAAQQRFALTLFELFALVALLLGGAGIYGVLAGAVAERRREIGVRSALGAAPRELLADVLRQGMKLAALGALVGLLLAALGSGALQALLFGVDRFDAATYAGVLGLLLVVAVVASSVPAWRAARVDPAVTLREQ